MDEPCSALDPIATAKIEELIHELRGRYTIAIVTHNMQQAARVSQRTAFFHLGELVEYGKTVGNLHQPARAAHPGLHHRPLRLIGDDMMATSSGHTIKAFDEDLDRLRALISQMGGLAEHAIRESMRCLVQRDLEGAQKIVENDKKLDALEIETEQPRGPAHRASRADGRRPSRCRRGDEDLERGRADRRLCQEHRQARALCSTRCSNIEPLSLMPEMARIATEMVHDVLDAFVERDAEAAVRVVERDQAVDDFYNSASSARC